MKIRVYWDTSDTEYVADDLPYIVNVPDEIYESYNENEDDVVSDWLSNEYGYCVNSWTTTFEI